MAAATPRRGIASTKGRFTCMCALAYKTLRLLPDEKEALVARLVPGKTSLHDLTNPEADLVIDEMKRLAGQPVTRPQERERRRARGQSDITLLITPTQKERLAELTRDLIAAGHSPGYLERVRLRACGRPYPLTSNEAVKAIEAMKAVAEREKPATT